MRFTHLDLLAPNDYSERIIHRVVAAQVKFNGVRVLVTKSKVSGQTNITALTKEGKSDLWPQLSNITRLRESIEHLPDYTSLDCELHVPGMPETSVKTLVIASDPKLVLSPFAIPVFGGEDFRSAELKTVCRVIQDIGFDPPETQWVKDRLATVEDIDEWLGIARSRKIEGWVLKAKHYEGWWKLKPVKTVDCVVTKLLPGEGKHLGRLGAIELSLLEDDGTYTKVGNVGTGFTDVERTHVWGNPHSVLGKVVEVAYDSLAANGALKFPRFKRFRDDKEAAKCSITQIRQ